MNLKKIYDEILSNLDEILTLRNTRVKKEDDSYVTEGDLLVQNIIFEAALRLDPEVVFISEEHENDQGMAFYADNKLLIIDPIDGTENFTSGLPEWGVSLCYYEQGVYHSSLVGCPELNRVVYTGNSEQKYTSRIAGISSSLTKEDILKLAPGFEYRILGCCVYNMTNVINGSFATFENPKGAKVWDIIGGLNLALDNGKQVTLEGQPYQRQLLAPNAKYTFKIQ